MRINPFVMPVLVLAALFGSVFGAQAMGQWTSSGRVAIDPSKMTAADLKGWMTLQDVMSGLKISQDELYSAGKIPAEMPPSTALNKLEALVPGFSVTTLREALAAKLDSSTAPATGAPAMPVGDAGASGITAPTPMATAAPTRASDGTGEVAGSGPTPLPAGKIKGSMTLRSVSEQCAVPLDQIVTGLSLPAETNPDTLIKDLIGQGKISEVTAVQNVVAALQNK